MRANAIAVLDATPPPSVRLYRATQGEQQEINDPGAGEHSNSTAPHRLIFSALATLRNFVKSGHCQENTNILPIAVQVPVHNDQMTDHSMLDLNCTTTRL